MVVVPISQLTLHMNKKHLIIILPIIAIIIAFASVLGWLYMGNLTQAKKNVFNKTPLPAAMIGSKFVATKDLLAKLQLANQIFGGEEKITTEGRGQVYDQLLLNKKLEVLTNRYGIKATDDDIQKAYQSNINKYAAGDEKSFSDQLSSYAHMDIATFKNQVVRQEVLLAKLSIWYYEQESKNQEAYKKARALLSKLDTGAKFEDVAKENSAVEADKSFAGDTGFFNYEDLLPEFQKAVNSMSQNQVVLTPSRYGLHIMKLLARAKDDSGKEQLQLQQIFIEGGDFSAWLKEQNEQIRTIKFLKDI